ncbi:hypothetical protein D3C81_1636700 [compost metagenome]
MDFKLDPTSWDIIWHNGPLQVEDTTQPLTETVAQRLKIRLLSFYGDWFMDTTYGVPYFQRLLGVKQTSKAAADLIFQTQILAEDGVKEIESFNSSFVNRQYSLTFRVKVVTGEVTAPIVINPLN